MSILLTIVVDVKKFFSDIKTDVAKFAAAFVKIFNKAPAAIQVVENFVGELAPIVVTAVGLADPAVEPAVAAALSTVETGLAAIEATLEAAVTGNSLVTQLQNFAATVPALLKGLNIKNPALTAEVTKIVNLVVGELAVIIPAAEAWVAQLAAKATTPAA
jgi:hypothetical protein